MSERSVALAEANRLDIAAAPSFGLSDAAVDRLRLTPQRIADMAKALDEVAALPEPIGEIISSSDPSQWARGAEGAVPRWA